MAHKEMEEMEGLKELLGVGLFHRRRAFVEDLGMHLDRLLHPLSKSAEETEYQLKMVKWCLREIRKFDRALTDKELTKLTAKLSKLGVK